MAIAGKKPRWLTFDCYGTLIKWDEGLLAAVNEILARQHNKSVAANTLIEIYDKYEHELEQTPPHRRFRDVAGSALAMAMNELGLSYAANDIEILTHGISRMPPFPEVPATLARLKGMGFRLCIISNTDDDVIAGNVSQLGGHVERVISAEQAQAYKPSSAIFAHAFEQIGVSLNDVVHVCASPHLDLAAAKVMGFRTVWINRGTGRKPLPDYVPDAEMTSLDKLPGALEAADWNAR